MHPEAEGVSGLPALSQIGNYHLVRELGRGAMGTVYLAHQESLARDLAVKVLAPEFTREPEFQERFRREARIAASLKHPHIVQVYDADFRDGLFYIAMEYLGAQNLRDVMRAQEGPFPVHEAVAILDQILQALGHAHSRGVVHRDVKPANVLVDDEGRVALTDFSIARATSEGALTRSGAMIGTPEYMAPEQFEGLEVDGRTDLYGAAVIGYELLTGVHPFRAETTAAVMKAHLFKRPPPPSELLASLQPFDSVLLKGLEKDPDARYATAEDFRKALLEAGGGGGEKDRLDEFLAAILQGRISMDEAVRAHALVKEAIDHEFRRVQTVLIADLAGSTKLKQPDRTLHADSMFRTYRKAVNDSLETFGCRSFDWSGDGVLGLFDSAADAVLAGLEIQRRLDEVCQSWGQPGILSARLGVNTGSLYLDPRRSLGEFASRTVDETGHLQKDCPTGGVAVSEATMQAAGPVAAFVAMGANRDGVQVWLAWPTGRPIPCPTCERSIPVEGRFCPGCGRNLSVPPPPPATAELVPAETATGRPSGSSGHGGPGSTRTDGATPGASGSQRIPVPPSGSSGRLASQALPSGSSGHGPSGRLAPQAPPSGSSGHGLSGRLTPQAPPSGSSGHGLSGRLTPQAPPSGSSGHGPSGVSRPPGASVPPQAPPRPTGPPPSVTSGPVRPQAPPPPPVQPISPPAQGYQVAPVQTRRLEQAAETRRMGPAEPPGGGGVWWLWAMLVALFLVMFAGGLAGAEGRLGGALIFGGMLGVGLLGLVSPILAAVLLVKKRVGPGLQAAVVAGLIWGMALLLLLAGLTE